MEKRVAIVGAGVSGLVSIQACLQEGLDVTCYEATDGVAGTWRYREEVEPDTASLFASVVANTSKELSAFSQFPPDEDMASYPHHTRWYQYICDYAVTFGLLHHIKFLHKVVRVTMAEEVSPEDDRLQGRVLTAGQWLVEVHDLQRNLTSSHVFDAVLVCNGHLTYGTIPPFPGIDSFQGTKIHSGQFRRPESFAGQTVLVVGFGNSALDIAIDCSAHAKKVYVSSRRGGWVSPRTAPGGAPGDATRARRLTLFLNRLIPQSWRCSIVENNLNRRFDHAAYGIKPFNRALNQYPIVNDYFQAYLFSGRVLMRPDIDHFKNHGVVFRGHKEATEIDAVIFATGYEPRYPFLTGLEFLKEKLDSLYKLVFPIWLEHPTLAFIGLLTSGYPVLPLAEVQARWVARVLTNRCTLPSVKHMAKDAVQVQRNIDKQFYKGFCNRTYIYGPVYTDEIASFIGVKPNLWKLLFTDPRLFWAVLAGPMVPYHYRLQGPHTWAGARAATLRAEDSWKRHFTKVGEPSVHVDRSTGKRSVVLLTCLGLAITGACLYKSAALSRICCK